ncbi:pnk protein [Thysanoplusia orichalcea nucleopolyhedrovirus]|uniref:Pnk protein n=1 Tax=Thysanoplusia orichalcea nucleopolyhedrovirus TaxID=101850 RepID=L0CJW3_9ABAC|nr:pnk protein [Thysanoplusia orichalcea nucleopolyhedrovirus]AGA16187.1 pnk protein [Thysanoplusia orichalcea nucleopolyhedrovirus]
MWTTESTDLYAYVDHDGANRYKVAAFDLDGTLISPKTQLKFPKDRDDWKLLPCAFTLKHLYELGYDLVVFTNQSRLGSGKMKSDDLLHKLYNIKQAIGAPISFYVAPNKDEYRKPNTKMWFEMVKQFARIDETQSFYVGDAAGRINLTTGHKDFSDSDKMFAKNLNLQFYTPEQFVQLDFDSLSAHQSR